MTGGRRFGGLFSGLSGKMRFPVTIGIGGNAGACFSITDMQEAHV
jgi:hypothetical protein